MPIDFERLLVTGVERGASDFHLKAGAPPILRIHGRLIPQGDFGGITASGKSTTLAAMIDFINRNRNDHIITIEDPIEFTHEDINCVISQREIGHDSASFAIALRAALREDPDVILLGEMRDPETM